MLKIVQAPNKVLSEIAKKVNKIDKNLLNLISEMANTLQTATDPEGIGLAAPQVEKSLSLFIIKESKKSPLFVFINPKIDFEKSKLLSTTKPKKAKKPVKDKDVKLEGCLSLQDVWGVVKRFDKISISYQNEKGEQKEEVFSGFFATIIQHEYDHLQGILFPKRVFEQNEKLYKSSVNKKGEVEFNEISL